MSSIDQVMKKYVKNAFEEKEPLKQNIALPFQRALR